MSVEQTLPEVLSRKAAILEGDSQLIARQKQAGKLTARERVGLLCDENSFVEIDVLASDCGVIAGYATVEGNPVYLYAQDFTVGGGAVGEKHARKALKVMEMAKKTGCPVIALLDSAGARLSEGAGALEAYATLAAASARLSGVVPQITLILGPCGGTASVIAQMSDISIQAGKGELFVNGPLVVSAAGNKNVSMDEIAGTDASLKSGGAMLGAKTEEEAIGLARKLVSMLPVNNLDEAVFAANDTADRTIEEFDALENADDVRSIIKSLADEGEFIELYEEFASSMITGLMKLDGRTVAVVANDPVKDEGRLTVYGCKKAARLVSFADSFSIPVLNLVSSNGMKINTAPQGELARAGAALMYQVSDATCPKVSVILGNAIGMAYAAMGSKAANDIVYAWPGAVISAVTTAIGTQMLLGDEMTGSLDPAAKRRELEEKYATQIADGVSAAQNGYVDDVIQPSATRQALCRAFDMLSGKREERVAKKHGNMPL